MSTMTACTEAPRLLLRLPALLAWLVLAAPAAATVEVRQDAGHWVIEVQRADRASVWQALAAASGSTLAAPAMAGGRPMTLQWRGARLEDAWRRVLRGDQGHALQCGPRHCRVWVLLAADRPAAAAQPLAVTAPQPAAAVSAVSAVWSEPDPPGLFPSD